MSTISSPFAELCPAPPDWSVRWSTIEAALPFVAALRDVPQDASFHAEGDVGIHTQMVCEALAGNPAWRGLPVGDRQVVFYASLLHDWGKLFCTKTESDGRISSRGHSGRGEALVRALGWRAELPFLQREQIAALVRYHQIPFFLVDRDDAERLAITVTQTARADLLALVAWADAAGRECAKASDRQRLLDNVALFGEYCRERDCFERPFSFASDHSRFWYFHRPDRDPRYHAYDDAKSDVIVLSGLPGAGKDTWVRTRSDGRSVVSLDALRAQLDVDPEDPQGPVIDAARQQAKEYLRRGEPFVWNGTNLSRPLRQTVVSLFADYNARVRFVYLECDEPTLRARNRERTHRVPDAVIDRLIDKWSPPDLTEAHAIEYAAL